MGRAVTTAAARAYCRKRDPAWHKTTQGERKRLLAHARKVLAEEAAEAARCVICLDSEKTMLVVPCGHKCMCEPCAVALRGAGGRCPLCRGPVLRATKVYE